MSKLWRAYGETIVLPGDHLRPVPKRWNGPGAAVASRQVGAFTDRLPEDEVVAAHSPSVAPFVGVGRTGNECSLERNLLERGGSTVICFTELLKSPGFLPQGHAGGRLSAKIAFTFA